MADMEERGRHVDAVLDPERSACGKLGAQFGGRNDIGCRALKGRELTEGLIHGWVHPLSGDDGPSTALLAREALKVRAAVVRRNGSYGKPGGPVPNQAHKDNAVCTEHRAADIACPSSADPVFPE